MENDMRYNDIYKRNIRGDSCCPFWRVECGGTCAAQPSWKGQQPCKASEDGGGCPVFKN